MELVTFSLLSLIIINTIYFALPYLIKFDGEIVVDVSGEKILAKIKNGDYVNAFSLYNGSIIITSRSLSLEESEIKAIIAHELGHLKLHHHLKMLLILNALLFITLISISYLPIFIPLIIFFVLFQRFLSRKFELEADYYAARLVGKDALKKVILNYGENKSNILSTHPSSLTRIKKI